MSDGGDSSSPREPPLRQLEASGFVVLPGVFAPAEAAEILRGLTEALAAPAEDGTLRSRTGSVYGSRNVLTLWTKNPGTVKAKKIKELRPTFIWCSLLRSM